ncbi:peptidase C15 pyroglutamyl peptidase I-like protein [Mycena pura]|uniref:Peptidase C15 pyroglutamyl peptidase I-like protein n=1 Tax=Mycena pura TaxID=153505 RepID=A0AAD6YF95_9AGAR|nr:peptidase C15 pyroglutamyl peptidase I-like protein [Mycena pura]
MAEHPPFGRYEENPSWLAVKTLHDTIIMTTPARGQPPKGATPDSIHITTLNIPCVYSAVLESVPGMHAQPPVLPDKYTPPTSRPPPEDGFSLIVHVGVGLSGGLRAERLAHKTGYTLLDHEGQSPPLVIGKDSSHGFGPPRYGDEFADELLTVVDVDNLVKELTSGSKPLMLAASNDPGRYLCDFIYYCSLSESQRACHGTPVLFVHCPPIGQQLSTEEVAEGLKRIVSHVCSQF